MRSENENNRIYIRVDGNEIIATGHVMRCISVAEQLRKLGAEVFFIVADSRPSSLITERGFKVDVLDTVWNDLDSETKKLCSYVKARGVKAILLDSYFVTREYLQELSQYTKIIYIDDLNSFVYPVDTVINYGAFNKEEMYNEIYRQAGMDTHFLVGSRYIPLREEFALCPYNVRKNVKKVLITTGGTDRLNVAGGLIKRIIQTKELPELELHVIVGCFNQNKEVLYALSDENDNVNLHENVKNMSEWMRGCDVAVSAAGTTTYELCACGIPSICLEIADNQEGAEKWEALGYMLYAGNAYKNKEQCLQRCVEGILRYMNGYEERAEKSRHMQSLVDGYGAKRIAQYLLGRLV